MEEETTFKQIDKIFEEAERKLSNKALMIKEELYRIKEKIIREHVDLK